MNLPGWSFPPHVYISTYPSYYLYLIASLLLCYVYSICLDFFFYDLPHTRNKSTPCVWTNKMRFKCLEGFPPFEMVYAFFLLSLSFSVAQWTSQQICRKQWNGNFFVACPIDGWPCFRTSWQKRMNPSSRFPSTTFIFSWEWDDWDCATLEIPGAHTLSRWETLSLHPNHALSKMARPWATIDFDWWSQPLYAFPSGVGNGGKKKRCLIRNVGARQKKPTNITLTFLPPFIESIVKVDRVNGLWEPTFFLFTICNAMCFLWKSSCTLPRKSPSVGMGETK